MSVPRIRGSRLGGSPDLPPLVVGPSLGTSVETLWSAVARRLARTYHVIGWDLPGHGISPPPRDAFSIEDLAAAVVDIVENTIGKRRFTYAGVSAAGAVGLHLLLGYPDRVVSAALICTAARIGDPDDWRSRAQVVRTAGTGEVVASSVRRWFARGFFERDPACARALVDTLRNVDNEGYAKTCQALADFDARDRLAEIETPVVAVAGANDVVTPPDSVGSIAANVAHGRFVTVANAAHLVPAEQPDRIADVLAKLARRTRTAAACFPRPMR
jgi:3-oxoadipate enol-lactonase/4-carboxymuconolactone decarboxylase